jgi:ArsR family transcriptional regulator, arsenate/arsenite/antimonite-responsive transcriptional repressor
MNGETLTTCCPPARAEGDFSPIEGPEANAELATLAKAIAHPVRVEILRILVRKNACAIVDELPLAQSTVSQHLKILKAAGLLRGEVDGPRVNYCIEPLMLRRLKDLVGGL